MTYAAWEPRYRVATIAPGKIDLFVVTFIDGRRAAVQPITEYDGALAKARAFHRDNPRCQIKVLPVDGKELRNLVGVTPADPPEPLDPALRQEVIGRLTQIARDSSDGDARQDAFDLLRDMGVFKP